MPDAARQVTGAQNELSVEVNAAFLSFLRPSPALPWTHSPSACSAGGHKSYDHQKHHNGSSPFLHSSHFLAFLLLPF